jgi:hypothetical protein
MLAETYATLLNRKIIIPSSKTNYVAIDQDYWTASLIPLIQTIYVDEAWYLDKYPDVKQAVAEGKIASARQHYCRFGYLEHRMPYPIAVDEAWYLDQYPDVRAAVLNQDFVSAQAHFEEVGFKEGRLSFPNFVLRSAAP